MDLYGSIYKVNLGGPRIVVGNQELVNEVCDQDRFKKVSKSRTMVEISASSINCYYGDTCH